MRPNETHFFPNTSIHQKESEREQSLSNIPVLSFRNRDIWSTTSALLVLSKALPTTIGNETFLDVSKTEGFVLLNLEMIINDPWNILPTRTLRFRQRLYSSPHQLSMR